MENVYITVGGEQTNVNVIVSGEQPSPVVIETPGFSAPVLAVNGKQGFVVLNKSDIGLDLVENLSLISASGYLQYQLDNLDNTYASESQLSGLSGQLVASGENLSQLIYSLSGYVKTQDSGIKDLLNVSGLYLDNLISSLSGSLNETGSYLVYQIEQLAQNSSNLYYPLSGNPANYLTGVDLSSYVTKSDTGIFLTSSDLAPYLTGFNSGDYVLKSETGIFLTGVDLSSYVQHSDTGILVNRSETGAFYPSSNPVGYITGVDLSNYALKGDTGNFLTDSDTGIFYPAYNPSGFITGIDLSSYVTGDVVRPTDTGNFISKSQTGAFYPYYNPSGFLTGFNSGIYALKSETGAFITGVDLSPYVTGAVVRPSDTGDFIIKSQTGQYYPANNPSGFIDQSALSPYLTGFNSGNYVQRSETGVFASLVNLNTTGSYLNGLINTASGTLQNQFDNLDSEYASQVELDILSGNLGITGNVLQNQINNLYSSGFLTGFNSGAYVLKSETGVAYDFFGVNNTNSILNRTMGAVTSITYSNGVVVTIHRLSGVGVTGLTSNTGKTKNILRDVSGTVTGIILL